MEKGQEQSEVRGDAPSRRRTLPVLGPFFDSRRVRQVTLPRRGLLGGMRVRKKLIVLHTLFTLVLTAVLVFTLRPAVSAVVREAELDESMLLLTAARGTGQLESGSLPSALRSPSTREDRLVVGTAAEVGITEPLAADAISRSGEAMIGDSSIIGECAVAYLGPGSSGGKFAALAVRIKRARAEATRLYVFAFIALLGVYVLVAAALEVFVLPENVYRPIRRVLDADDALLRGDQAAELIPASAMPSDELGEIMRSRNESVMKLRRQEAALADALARLEQVATDLKRKNHLLEAAQRNLADADRLRGLGIMSAGIAHELNTPLAVMKGLAERLNQNPAGGLAESDAALMLRVVNRLEKLGDSLLDYARVRPPRTQRVSLAGVVHEALTLVRIDRDAKGVEFVVDVPESLNAECDADRMVQVMVNLLRNAVDAVTESVSHQGARIDIGASLTARGGNEWISITVQDTGPGIDPGILPRLFEPFASTRLDSQGTGLGLAVAEGIVREHGGVLLARNRSDRTGAVFEVVLPVRQGGA